uniref:DUF1618 domain-containing protein n=1 Tax=Oryza meridionalis TaxID=40149 RepID=A0A0E0DC97_9ORYZ
MAFIADRRNATTARCAMRSGLELQITLCVDAPPPRVSYFCVWCPSERPTELATEPCIVAAEADLFVFAAVRGNARDILNLDKTTSVFIYQAAGGGGCGGAPSIRRLGDLEPHFSAVYNIGLLRHSVAHPGGGGDGEHGHYYIVTLHPGYTSSWEYVLYVFDSMTGSWSDRTVSLGPEHRHSQFNCSPSKVVVLGNGGLMAFVDLWRGIIVVDVLAGGDDVPARFIHLPRALRSRRIFRMDAGIVRDVVVVNGRVKVADCFWFNQQQQQQQQPDVIDGGATSNVASRLRKVSMWSRMATWEEDDDWRRDYIFSVPDIIVDDDAASHLELLPELQIDGATGRRTLRGLHITRPAISLNDDDKVYFMAKVDPWDKRGWVIAVDMRSKKLEDVGIFRAERVIGVDLSYTLCRISKYFSTSTGKTGHLKRQGQFCTEYPHKRQAGRELDGAICAPAGSDDGTSMDIEDIDDNMDED